jgi:hypothetical protein
MYRYAHKRNITHFATLLGAEAEPQKRAVLMKLLVEEEDQLGHTQEQLKDTDSRVARADGLIARQRALISRLNECGKGTADAQSLLAGMMEVRSLFMSYRQKIIERIRRDIL